MWRGIESHSAAGIDQKYLLKPDRLDTGQIVEFFSEQNKVRGLNSCGISFLFTALEAHKSRAAETSDKLKTLLNLGLADKSGTKRDFQLKTRF